MQSTNQKANTFQSILGVFLHSCQTPEKVIEMLAHMGVCISTGTINKAIKSLSVNARCALQQLGRTFCAAIAYDNVDILLKAHVPTVEKSTENLKHLTSGLIFPLMHGVTREHLKCSKLLWEKSSYNPTSLGIQLDKKTYLDLVLLLAEDMDNESMTSRDHFVAWLYLRDLCTYGPSYFQMLLNQIGQPTAVEAIPVAKTDILPAYAMEVNNSTVSGNIQAIDSLLEQGGILNPDEIPDEDYSPDLDVSDYIVLFHGDLGTGKRIQSIRERRSIEETEYERKQMVYFCPGLFHCKMACVDTLHRMLIKPGDANKDITCLMNDAKILRPRETHILETKPTFRHMHQLVNHSGICRRLDCWRVLAEQANPEHSSLQLFAQSQPKLEDLKKMANTLALKYTSCEDLSSDRLKPSDERDEVLENSKLVLKYLALYEEFSWAMNFATRRAVRYNWLVNVAGKPGKFRAIDWYVELHNLQIKVNHGGQGPNRTIKRIIAESALVGNYKSAHHLVERNFLLSSQTTSHGEVDMTKTFAEILAQYEEASPHIFAPGRKASYLIDDVLNKGFELMQVQNGQTFKGSDASDEVEKPDFDDLVIELDAMVVSDKLANVEPESVEAKIGESDGEDKDVDSDDDGEDKDIESDDGEDKDVDSGDDGEDKDVDSDDNDSEAQA
ncbi:hypothetical protein JOM56_012994 [Amanita muscaria]